MDQFDDIPAAADDEQYVNVDQSQEQSPVPSYDAMPEPDSNVEDALT